MKFKTVELLEYKAEQTEEGFYISGYANTKGKPDAYGDIPTNFNDKPVYDLSRFKKNPVALVDHEQSVGNIFGAYTEVEEDEKGLRIKLRLMDNPQTDIAKHAVEAYKSGFARAFSIGGQWSFEDKDNPTHLTKAFIHEISGVAIGADQHSLASTAKLKAMKEITKAERLEVMEILIKEYRKSGSEDVLTILERFKEQ